MNQYWENVWDNSTITEYMGYVYGLHDIDSEFIRTFTKYQIHTVCDAACGFGKYSALLYTKGFDVCGFDLAESSIHLTKQILHFLGMDSITQKYITADITQTPYATGAFDAVVAHAIIDHLPEKDAKTAINEMLRIVRNDGLVYLSFSGMEGSNETNNDTNSYDGNYPLHSLNRQGLLYRYYTDEELLTHLLPDYHILNFTTTKHGDRDLILQKTN